MSLPPTMVHPFGRRLAPAVVLAVSLALTGLRLGGQQPPLDPGGAIASATNPDEGLTVRRVEASGQRVRFASADRGRRGIRLSMTAGAAADERALAFVDQHGARFGLQDRDQLRLKQRTPPDAVGTEHVRFQQTHQGVPVTGGQFIVHLRGAEVLAVNGRILEDLPEHVIPTIVPAEATRLASLVIEKYTPEQADAAEYLEPRLEVFVPSVFGDDLRPPRLAWFVEAAVPGVRQFTWIDAENGEVLLTFNQVAEARNRQVYNANSTSALPGTLARSEGQGATGVANVDKTYDYSGHTYDYFKNTHNRDSFDNAGATLVATVNYCASGSPCPYPNAFWNGTQVVFGDGLVADDVVAHEWTHAVTEKSADLYYYSQSGALNESFSDVFGETIDLLNGSGTDTSAVRWRLGEDITHPSLAGGIRHMMTPTLFGDPGKVSDVQYQCDAYSDSQGIHRNSGVLNHAFALLVDGGVYNGRTITAIGLSKAAKIWYRALTVYLTSGSGFTDAYDALTQSATDLIGTDGITSADRTELIDALLAVEMTRVPTCQGAKATPAMCPVGAPAFVFQEGMEIGSPLPWEGTNSSAGNWFLFTGYAKTGLRSFWGENRGVVSDHQIAMTSSVVVPTGGRGYFDHSYRFEASGGSSWDGGVIEYSVDNGATWVDAGTLIELGQTYGGTVATGFSNPLSGKRAFTGSSLGYTGTRLNLSTLAGQTVRLRFRIGTDSLVSDLGWFVDNVSLYTCWTYSVTPTVLGYPPTGGSKTVTVTAAPDAPWTATSDQGWLLVSPGSGLGSNAMTATATPHTLSVNPRSATISIRRTDNNAVVGTVAVTQTGPTPTLAVGLLAWTVDAAGGTREVTVTATPPDAAVAWRAVSGAPTWLTVSAAGGTGSGGVTLTAAAQGSSKERVGTVTVAGKAVTVRQRGVLPALTLTPPTWQVGASGGTQPVTLTATPSDLAWTAVSSAPWLRVNGVGTVTGTGTPAGPWTLSALAHTTSVTARVAVVRAGGTWQGLAPLTVARWGAAVGEIDGQVYVAGGQAGTVHQTGFHVYTVATNTWAALAASEVQTAPVSGVHAGKLYVAGGRTASGPVPRLRAYDPGMGTWTELAPMGTGRAEAAGGVIDGVLYVAGGQLADGTASDVLEAYDMATNTWSVKAALPAARVLAGGTAVDGKLYVVGGAATGAGGPEPTLYVYDPGMDSWTTGPTLPHARARLAAVEANGRLVVVGGSIGPAAHGSPRVDVFDPATSAWHEVAPLPVGRSGAAVVALHGRVYVLGGALPGTTLVATGQAHVYTSVWEPTVVVTQAGAAATYGTVRPPTLAYGATGGAKAVMVPATPGDAPWTVESDQGWLLVSPGSGVGSKTVTVTAAGYASSVVPRTATLTFRRGDGSVWQTVAVTQSGPTPTISLSPTSITVGGGGDTRTITVETVPADVPWTASSNQPWVTLTVTNGVGSGTVGLVIAENLGAIRAATVTLGGKTVSVTQEPGPIIDVIVLYTPSARAAQGGTAGIQSLIDLGISKTNQAYQNSGASQRIRLVRKEEVSYAESGQMPLDLSRLQSPADGYLDIAHALRNVYGADVVHLIVNSPDYCGIAYLMTSVSASFEPWAFGVNHYACISPIPVLAHELGHNMGLRHDLYVDSASTPYPYSHGYVNQAAFVAGASTSKRWRTVMAYDDQCAAAGFYCLHLDRFSSPSLTYSSDPMGQVTTADAARTLDNTMFTVAGFRAAVFMPHPFGDFLTGTEEGEPLEQATGSGTSLFKDASTGASSGDTAPFVRRSRRVAVDFGPLRAALPRALGGLDTTRELPLQLFPDVGGTAELVRVEPTLTGYVWVGRFQNEPESSVTLAVTGEMLSGSVVLDGRVYSIRPVAGGDHVIEEIDQAALPPELEPLLPVIP